MIEERAILAALERIARMQDSIRSGMDICRDTGLVFLRVYLMFCSLFRDFRGKENPSVSCNHRT